MAGIIDKLVVKAEEKKLQESILSKRQERRLIYAAEMLQPIGAAWFERLRERLSPLNPYKCETIEGFARRTTLVLGSIRIHAQEKDDPFPISWGVLYNNDEHVLSMHYYHGQWGDTHDRKTFPIELAVVDDERFHAFLDETWAFIEANLEEACKSKGNWEGVTTKVGAYAISYWDHFKFEPKVSLTAGLDL